jgi:Uncharacterized protein conserved in bacteria (DUF2252)
VLLEGRDEDDPLFLQVKEAEPSVLEAHLPKSIYNNPGHRVVAGQKLMQVASDIFLGWLGGGAGRCFYCRQLRDMKASARIEGFSPDELALYARICGWALARTPAPVTAWRLLPISARANVSPRLSPTSGRLMPIRSNETMLPTAQP